MGDLCTGAFFCDGDGCEFQDEPGFCSEAPGFKGCWEDSDCGGDFVCRAALACPPGTLCHGNMAHAGYCGELPAAGEGIAVSPAATSIKTGSPFWITVLNSSATLVFLDPCNAMVLQRWNSDDDKWQDWLTVLVMHDSCDQGQPAPYLAIPPGDGMVFGGMMGKYDAGTFRLQTLYKIGCQQGVVNPTCNDAEALTVNSTKFEVVVSPDR